VQSRQLLPRVGERPEVRRERDARQLPLEVVRELLAIAGMMEQAVDVVKDRPLVDLLVLVVRAELLERPIRDVLAAVGAITLRLDGARRRSNSKID